MIAPKIIKGTLWFNSDKDKMQRRLNTPNNNSGVGVSVPNVDDFSPDTGEVYLEFDDGTTGTANVDKSSFFNGCCHLIDQSIGAWSKANGLWARKIQPGQQSVPVYLVEITVGQKYEVHAFEPTAGSLNIQEG
jgi:hypothetical protein